MYLLYMLEHMIRCLEGQNNSDSQIIIYRGCMELLPIAILQSVSLNSLQIFNTFRVFFQIPYRFSILSKIEGPSTTKIWLHGKYRVK